MLDTILGVIIYVGWIATGTAFIAWGLVLTWHVLKLFWTVGKRL